MKSLSDKQRTLKQNSALHLYYEHLAKALNDAGLTVMKTLRQDAEIPWSKESVKELIWRPVMEAQIRKSSTTEMTTKDVDKIKNTIDRYLAEKHDLVVDFPSIETVIYQKSKEDNENRR